MTDNTGREKFPPRVSRDWPEDSGHENGNYSNTCCQCGRAFTGHKRRIVCKACATGVTTPAKRWQASATATPDESRELAYHPLVATEEMLNAARDWSLKKYGLGVGRAEANECWQVMYRAFNESRKR